MQWLLLLLLLLWLLYLFECWSMCYRALVLGGWAMVPKDVLQIEGLGLEA